MEELLNQLNDSQKAAVIYNEGPSLVVAGAGSGKTRVLTYKIAGLLKQGYEPFTLLALTFTNKAAAEMKTRIGDIVGQQVARYLWMGTFHSIFSKILRREAEHIGFKADFTIYDTSDSKNLIKTIIKEMNLDDKVYKPTKVISRISHLKNNLITPKSYQVRYDLQEADMYAKIPRLKEIYTTYMSRCFRAGVMDFDDLLLYTNILFRDFPDVLAKYQQQFQFILVDEYQDTNFAQHLIVKKLADKHHKISVVGDDAQSIYSFRGANIENILRFKEVYPECKVFKLERNYRSTPNIVEVANSLIAKNKSQIKKKVYSERMSGSVVKVLNAYSDTEESNIVGNLILGMVKQYEYKDFAILYRTNAQSRLLEDALRKRTIPYKIHGGHSFYQRKEIKDVLSYFRLLLNPSDEEAFKRIVNYPARGIGETTINKISEVANLQNISYWEVISDPLKYNLPVNNGTINKLRLFRELISNLMEVVTEKDAYTFADEMIKSTGIRADLYQDSSPEGQSKQENIEELLNGIHEFCLSRQEEEGIEKSTIGDFLQVVTLLTDQDTDKPEDMNKVTMMTIHAAKGLEFKNVIVVGLEEELFPSNMCLDSENGIEEERRLFYVAITRAEENCIITYAKTRFKNGTTNYTLPSRFLKDIDSSLLELPSDFYQQQQNEQENISFSRPFYSKPFERESFGNKYEKNESSDRYVRPEKKEVVQNVAPVHRNLRPIEKAIVQPEPPETKRSFSSADVGVGTSVEHEKFGKGVVTAIEGNGNDKKATISFENLGEKKILLKFARLRIL